MKFKIQHIMVVFSFLLLYAWLANPAFGHCQIPCGIYGDELRFDMIKEHLVTIEKSMVEIERLSKQQDRNYNQIVRWVMNKEKHATELDGIITYYFMAQRVKMAGKEQKDDYRKYQEQILLLHQVLVYSMKAKQTTDVQHVEKLRSLIAKFHSVYFKGKNKNHAH